MAEKTMGMKFPPELRKFYEEIGHTNKYTTLNHYIDMEFVMEERRRILYEQKGKK